MAALVADRQRSRSPVHARARAELEPFNLPAPGDPFSVRRVWLCAAPCGRGVVSGGGRLAGVERGRGRVCATAAGRDC